MAKLAEIKTKETSASVEDFINSIKDEAKRKDSLTILNLMKKLPSKNQKSGEVLSLDLETSS